MPRRAPTARPHIDGFGVATVCGWGRLPERDVGGLLELHAAVARRCADGGRDRRLPGEVASSEPGRGLDAATGGRCRLAYDNVDAHGWYRNLDLIVEELAANLNDGDVLLDYSGGTGILLDRLRLRIFDRQSES